MDEQLQEIYALATLALGRCNETATNMETAARLLPPGSAARMNIARAQNRNEVARLLLRDLMRVVMDGEK